MIESRSRVKKNDIEQRYLVEGKGKVALTVLCPRR